MHGLGRGEKCLTVESAIGRRCDWSLRVGAVTLHQQRRRTRHHNRPAHPYSPQPLVRSRVDASAAGCCSAAREASPFFPAEGFMKGAITTYDELEAPSRASLRFAIMPRPAALARC